MLLKKVFSFEAAHHLPHVDANNKCSRLHGHSFRVVVQVRGPVNEEKGWVLDFGEIRRLVEPIIDILDHRYLNEIEGLENPTSEHIAQWIWERLHPVLPILMSLEVYENPSSGCVYDGDRTL